MTTEESPGPSPSQRTCESAAEAGPGALADGLQRMASVRDLLGFQITARRRIAGMRWLKRTLRRLLFQVFARQSDFNEAAYDVIRAITGEENSARRMGLAQARMLARAEDRILAAEAGLTALRSDISSLRTRLEGLTAIGGTRDEDIHNLDYVGLQARFRGDEEEIAERQRVYVERFTEADDVLDIGCGRGEFLSLLRDAGIRARGVDLDAEMVALCREAGLDVVRGDALTHLQELPQGSLGGIFAAQLIEHITAERLISLVREAHRTLRPGGVVILETVNPASVIALTTFYLDFTHVKPIHPLALEWLAESTGFVDVETLYLSPVEGGPRLEPLPEGLPASPDAADRFNNGIRATNEVLYGPREYALIARRP